MTLPQIFFFYQAFIIIFTAILAVTRKNPVHSVILMLVMFFHIASVYLFLNAEFMAAVQVIVYAGAILVLFLFVIFLLNLRSKEIQQRNIANWPTAAVLSGALFTIIAIAVKDIQVGPSGKYTIEYINKHNHINAVGELLYTENILAFEVASLILLVAIIGAITLTKKDQAR